MRNHLRCLFQFLFTLAFILNLILPTSALAGECFRDRDCEVLYRPGSKCLSTGMCSNPFASGCLKAMLPDHETLRLCNSDDKDTTACRTSPLNYPEIRVHYQNWEVAIFFSWILQISLMELLDVPVRVGLGKDTFDASFYNMDNKLMYSPVGYSWDGLRKANELNGDCLQTDEDCVHVLPDAWASQHDILKSEYEDGQLDYLDGNGQIGKDSLFLPKFTAMKYPFTVTYHGLSQNRRRLAEIFKRPTTWADYCHLVSSNNCTTPDGVAEKYPDEADAGKYFANGYIGHFRATEDNICTGLANDTCTGHATVPPCDWATFLEGQAYWLDMALKANGPNHVNGGYSYGEMIQIWNAANATKSDVIMHWYEPDSFVEVFRNTEAEFTRIYLPPPSLQCEAERLSVADRCSEDPVVRRGTKGGACDTAGHVTKKVIARTLRDTFLAAEAVDQSPAYNFIQNFNMEQLEINEMLGHYVAKGLNGYAARDAVCSWVANNTDYLKTLMPPFHPKIFRSREDYGQTVTLAAYGLGFLALAYILVCTAVSFKKRTSVVFVYSQVQFIFVMLFGLFLVAIGAILNGIEPNSTLCMVRVWLVSLGYTFELVPLIIKVTAMNQIMKASKKMRRVNIKPSKLYTSLMVLSGIVAVYLVVWTILDPSIATEVRLLEDDRITVTSHFGCRSKSAYWNVIYLLWEGILILWCSVLAFQSRNVQAEFNESKTLGMMIYSHFIFLVLRVVVSIVFEKDAFTSSLATSYLLSLDIIVALMIYLLPKMVMPSETIEQQRKRGAGRFSNYSKATSEIQDQVKRASVANGSRSSVSSDRPGRISSSFENHHDHGHSSSNGSHDDLQGLPERLADIYESSSSGGSVNGVEEEYDNGVNPMHSNSSTGRWVGDSDKPEHHNNESPLNSHRVLILPENATDAELREKCIQMNQELERMDHAMLQKDTEVSRLKRRVKALQEIKNRQASEIHTLQVKEVQAHLSDDEDNKVLN